MPTARVGRVLVIVMFRSGTGVEVSIGSAGDGGPGWFTRPTGGSVELDQDSNAVSRNSSTLSAVTTGA